MKALWTLDEDNALRAMAAQGLTSKRMANELGRSVGGIKSRLEKLDIRLRVDCTAQLDAMIHADPSATSTQIQRKLAQIGIKLSGQRIRERRRALGYRVETDVRVRMNRSTNEPQGPEPRPNRDDEFVRLVVREAVRLGYVHDPRKAA